MRYCRKSLVILFGCVMVSFAQALPYALSSDGNAVVRITPETTAPSLNTGLIVGAYPGYNVSNVAMPGSFTVSNYSAGWQEGAGGAQFQGVYRQSTPASAGSQLNYIQIINTNDPLGGAKSPYIDPQPNDDTLPYYWTKSEANRYSTATSVSFSDFSKRDPASLASIDPITWSASLYPVIDEGNNVIKVGSGVQWGWDMKPATVGASTGTFNGPTPTCPPATCSGMGTGSIRWGEGSQGGLSFTGANFAPKVGEAFKIGTLSYTNGATAVGTALDDISLNIALAFDNVGELNFEYHNGLSINNTANTDDPTTSADFVNFSTGGFRNAFHVFEGASASADLMAMLTPVLRMIPAIVGDKDPFSLPDLQRFVGYDLRLVALANPSNGGFVSVVAVPLPDTISLLLIGLLAAMAAAKPGVLGVY